MEPNEIPNLNEIKKQKKVLTQKEYAILGTVVVIGSLAAIYIHEKFIAHQITRA